MRIAKVLTSNSIPRSFLSFVRLHPEISRYLLLVYMYFTVGEEYICLCY